MVLNTLSYHYFNAKIKFNTNFQSVIKQQFTYKVHYLLFLKKLWERTQKGIISKKLLNYMTPLSITKKNSICYYLANVFPVFSLYDKITNLSKLVLYIHYH